MRKGLVFVVAIACGLMAAIFVQRQVNRMPGGVDDPALSLPPDILTPQELGGRQALFDHQTLTGWTVTGPVEVTDGTLVLGGETGAKVFLTQEIDIGQTLEFHFFQEGGGKAVLHMQPVLRDPLDPHASSRRDFEQSLNLSGYEYKRWHAAKFRAEHQAGHMSLSQDIKPLCDGMGSSSSGNYAFPSLQGCRCRIGFEVAPGSKLYVRNVTVAAAPPPLQP